MSPYRFVFSLLASFCLLLGTALAQENGSISKKSGGPIRVLFLGDEGHHRPGDRFPQLAPVLASRGIEMTYSNNLNDLNPETLAAYDALAIYANWTKIEPPQEKALLEYVQSGHGFVALHCASYCFLNSPEYVRLVGAQFARHGGQVFATEVDNQEHPVVKGWGGLRSWDETYIHRMHNEDRTVLEYRAEGDQAAGIKREPWTWVRNEGQGRVFYTAWGHDERTWGQPSFQDLIERGIRWTVKRENEPDAYQLPKVNALPKDLPKFEYVDVGPKIPNYTKSTRWGVQGEPMNTMQLPLSPEASQKHLVVPEDFVASLWAAEPSFNAKPIAMNWDHRGRLWVCATVDYPNELQPKGSGRDYITICEDTDGDHKADKFTKFASGLSIPSTLVFYRDGVIVQDGQETVFLKDTNGDDQADVRKVLITGWALGDTHGGVSNFRYGPDNWIWGMQGYNDSRPTFPGSTGQNFRMGWFRFRLNDANPPEVVELEFIRGITNNAWGVGISEEGLIFGSSANRAPSFFVPIPNRYYERVRGWTPGLAADLISDTHLFKPITEKVRQVDHHGGYTAGCGHALYTARSYPKFWWNRTAFVCGPTGHLVGTFVLSRNGASYRSTSPINLIASDDEWTAPIMAEVGPDGNVWVLDWYNYIVQHNPTPEGFKTGKGNAYESDLRDKKHGRIYRVEYKGKEGGDAGSEYPLQGEITSAKLLATLSHPNMMWRLHAQRLIVERKEISLAPQLYALVKDTNVDEIGLNVGAMHGLWTLSGLGLINDKSTEGLQVALAALKHPSAGVRRAAITVLPASQSTVSAILSSGLLNDKDEQVRLAAVLALADGPGSAESAAALVERLGNVRDTTDRWFMDAFTIAGAANGPQFLEQLVADKKADGSREKLAEVIAEHVARSQPDGQAIERIVKALAQAPPSYAVAIIRGFERGIGKETNAIQFSPAFAAQLISLLEKVPADAQAGLLRLAAVWKVDGLDKQLAKVAEQLAGTLEDDKATVEKRVSAAQAIVGMQSQSDQAIAKILSVIGPQSDPDLVSGLLKAIGESRAKSVANGLIKVAQGGTPATRADAIKTLLSRGELTEALLSAIQKGDLGWADLALDQKQALQSHPEEKVRNLAMSVMRASGGVPNPDRQKVLDELMPLCDQSGNVERGKAAFKKHCANCHVHGTEGGNVGPVLTGMAVHPKKELLLNIVDPSRSVEGNYRQYTLLTVDGQVINGLLAAESRSAVELIDAQAKRHAVAREDIEDLKASTKSLMPEGFEKQMTKEELVDLLEFLTDKGKYLPLPVENVATVISTEPMFSDGPNNSSDRIVLPEWKPVIVGPIPFVVVDPMGGKRANAILLNGPNGRLPPRMPKSVTLPCNTAIKRVHLLGGISGWGFPYEQRKSTSMIVRLHFVDGTTEDHALLNGVHIADYIRRVDVPDSEFVMMARGQQLRHVVVEAKRSDIVKEVELVKGNDQTAPIVMAVTVERP